MPRPKPQAPTKRCIECGRTLPVDLFPVKKRVGPRIYRRSRCRTCHLAYDHRLRARRAEDPDYSGRFSPLHYLRDTQVTGLPAWRGQG
jgi:hypothetical protein